MKGDTARYGTASPGRSRWPIAEVFTAWAHTGRAPIAELQITVMFLSDARTRAAKNSGRDTA